MIELKKCNYITGDSNSVSYGLSKIMKFFELDGRNIILITKKSSYETNLKYFFDNKLEYDDFDDFRSLLNSGNLFRVDLIVVDLWYLRHLPTIEYLDCLRDTGVQHIIAARSCQYKNSDDDVTDYHINVKSNGLGSYSSTYTVSDNKNGTTFNLDDAVISYIRDKKIDGIIGNDFDN